MGWLIKGGYLVDPAAGLAGEMDLLVEDGLVVEAGRGLAPGKHRVYRAAGRLVAPGLIDMHTHLREPGQEHKETIASGAAAAVMGGYTAVAAMPNTSPPADSPAVIQLVRERARAAGLCRVYPLGTITQGQHGEKLAEMGMLQAAGAVAFSDDGKPVANAGLMRRALEYVRGLGMPLVSHCEEPALAGRGVMHEGYMSTILGLPGIPAAAEEVMAARDIILAELTGGRLHLAHLSTAGSMRLLRQAKERGLAVTAEVTPHHLTLTDAAVEGYDTSTKVNPPLRGESDRQALLEALAEGLADAIATDHAPHAMEEKEVEYDYAPFGLIGLETALPLVADRLVRAGVINWTRAIELLSANPARILGLPGGTLAPGSPADLTIIDPELELAVNPAGFCSRSRNTPFTGWRLRGWPVATMVGGSFKMHERRLPVKEEEI